VITAAMGAIVAHNRANQCGGLSLTAVKQKYTVRTRRYVPLSELSYCLHNASNDDIDRLPLNAYDSSRPSSRNGATNAAPAWRW
jgi:hypothetical protein